jgi:hypothetical protein
VRTGVAGAAVVLLWFTEPAYAHRLDEYLQATTIDVAKERVSVQVILTPGVEVVRSILGVMDADGDGVISDDERRAYTEQVIRELSLTIDGKPVRLRLVLASFPSVERMKEGVGDVELELYAPVTEGWANRRIVFENRHQRELSAYLANCLVPSDPDLRITAQRRNLDQSRYEVEYTQAGAGAPGVPAASWSTWRFWVGVNAVVLGVWGVVAMRRRWARLRNAAGKPAG